MQARTLDRWPDDSVRWALLDWQADIAANSKSRYRVEISGGALETPGSAKIRADQEAGVVSIDTGVAQFSIRAGGGFPFESVNLANRPAVGVAKTRFAVTDESGQLFTPHLERVELAEQGPLRVAVAIEGRLGAPGRPAALPALRLAPFLRGTGGGPDRSDPAQPAPGRASRQLLEPRRRGLGLSPRCGPDRGPACTKPRPARIRFSPEPSASLTDCESSLEIFQDSSGGENWRGSVHINRHRVVPNTFRGYRLRSPGQEQTGLRATPIVTLEHGDQWLGMAMEHFWQNFPKAVEATAEALTLAIVSEAVRRRPRASGR